tara:strand:+ start:3736 stop:4773 length:1038 start_codon:yes stop_codon:yes gene_type:complete
VCALCASSLADGVRATIVGNLIGVRTSTYRPGETKMNFDVHDQTGAISAVIWSDAFPTFAEVLKQGETYKFINVNVRANVHQGSRLELKIYPDTRVEAHAPVKLDSRCATIKELVDGVVRLRAVLAQTSEDVEVLRTGEGRRVLFADPSGDVNGFLEHDALKAVVNEGDAVCIYGKFVADGRNGPTVYVHTMDAVEDEGLASFWSATRDSHKAKKLKVEIVTPDKLADLKNVDAHTKGVFKGVVRSTSLMPYTLKNKRVKHSFSIVDDSMTAVDVGVFCDAEESLDVKIGDVVKLDGTISAFNTKSITLDGVDKVEKLAESPLYEWWEGNGGAVFDELSYDSRGM